MIAWESYIIFLKKLFTFTIAALICIMFQTPHAIFPHISLTITTTVIDSNDIKYGTGTQSWFDKIVILKGTFTIRITRNITSNNIVAVLTCSIIQAIGAPILIFTITRIMECHFGNANSVNASATYISITNTITISIRCQQIVSIPPYRIIKSSTGYKIIPSLINLCTNLGKVYVTITYIFITSCNKRQYKTYIIVLFYIKCVNICMGRLHIFTSIRIYRHIVHIIECVQGFRILTQ